MSKFFTSPNYWGYNLLSYIYIIYIYIWRFSEMGVKPSIIQLIFGLSRGIWTSCILAAGFRAGMSRAHPRPGSGASHPGRCVFYLLDDYMCIFKAKLCIYNYRCIAYSNVYWECLIKMRDIQSSEYSTGYSWVHYPCQSWDFCRMASKFHRLNRSTTKSGSAESFNNSGQGILVQEIVWIGFLNF